MKSNHAFIGLLTFGVLASSASAALLTYEGFDYTATTAITGQTGGTGFRTPLNPAWQGAASGTVAATGLTYTAIDANYTDFAPTGLAANMGGAFANDRLLAVDTGAAYATANLRGAGNFIGGSTVTGTLWGSYLVAASVWGTGSGPQMLFNLGSSAGTGTQASIRQTSAGSAIFLTNAAGGSISSTGSIATSSLSTTVPNLIVFRYQFNGASNDTLDVWLNPTSANDTAAITDSEADYVLNTPVIRSVNANGGLVFDEVRFGTTFNDVVPIPEPSSYLLGGIAMLSLLASRRRN